MGGGASKRGGNSALPTEMIRTRRGERRLPSVLQADGTRLTRASTTPNLGGAPILGGRSSRAESLTQSQDGESLHVMSIRSSLTPVGGRRSEGAAEQIRRIFDEYDVDQSNWWNKEDLDGFARDFELGDLEVFAAVDTTTRRKAIRQLRQKLELMGRISFEDFSAAVQPFHTLTAAAAKARMERYFLSIGIHEILAQAAMEAGIETVDGLKAQVAASGVRSPSAPDGPIGQMVAGATPRVVGAIKKGLRAAEDEEEHEHIMFRSLQEQYKKQIRLQQDLLASASSSMLVQLPTDHAVVGGLTGLIDLEDAQQLRKDLWDAAGKPETNPKKNVLIPEDKSTWSWENLKAYKSGGQHSLRRISSEGVCYESLTPEKMRLRQEERILEQREEVRALAELQRHAGRGYERKVHSAFNLLKLSACNNIVPFADHLYAQDKHELTHSSGKRVKYDLDSVVFETGNRHNSGVAMQRLKQMLLYPRLIWAFYLLDSDGNGFITMTDLYAGPEILSAFRLDSNALTRALVEDGRSQVSRALLVDDDGEEVPPDEVAAERGKLSLEKFLEVIVKRRRFMELYASPINSVTLPPEARVKAAIPVDAAFYAFSYPLTASGGNEVFKMSAAESTEDTSLRLTLILPLKHQDFKPDSVRRVIARLAGLHADAVTVVTCEEIKVRAWTLDTPVGSGVGGVRLLLALAVGHEAQPKERTQLCELFGGPGGRVAKLRDYGLEKLSTQTEYGKLRQEWSASCSEATLDWDDPFVCWITVGGFVYFDHTYDIVAINALCNHEVQKNTAALYLGRPSALPAMAVDPLEQGKRWVPISLGALRQRGFTHFAWVTPSEFLGDHIFTRSGGFAYLHREMNKSMFYPVARKAEVDPAHATWPDLAFLNLERHKPLPYDAPLHIEELLHEREEAHETPAREHVRSERYMAELAPEQAVFADGRGAVLGISKAIGAAEEDVAEWARTPEAGLEAIRKEVAAMVESKEATQEDLANLKYVLDEAASEVKVRGNDGRHVTRDKGHGGKTLQHFCEEKQARLAELKPCEVAALRFYTTSSFQRINEPLRRRAMPHPLKATTFFVYEGLKKLRAVHLQASYKFETRYLWRGLRDRVVPPSFLRSGGTEVACMSTSMDLDVVASYALSRTPLLFRIKVDSPMDLGAEIGWLSVFPTEREVLYPPLTFLKPMFTQHIKDVPDGKVITVKPSFPT